MNQEPNERETAQNCSSSISGSRNRNAIDAPASDSAREYKRGGVRMDDVRSENRVDATTIKALHVG